MVGHVLMDLCGDNSFQGLAEEREIGNRPVVGEVIRVQTRLLQYGGDRGGFETGGHCSRLQRGVDDIGDDGGEGG